MLKKDLIKHSPNKIKKQIDQLDQLLITNVLVKEYLKISFAATFTYLYETDELIVKGSIDYKILALDARDGTNFEHQEEMLWNETYLLSDFLDEEIDLNQLVTEQINANIPINLSNNRGTINKVGPGWQLLSEEEFEINRHQISDPRWAKLKEFKQKDK